MGRKKRVVRIDKTAVIKCPHCGKKSRVEIPKDRILGSWECTKCKNILITPLTKCCVICAFSNKKCSPSLTMEAKMKGLEIREKAPAKEKTLPSKTIILFDEKMLRASQ